MKSNKHIIERLSLLALLIALTSGSAFAQAGQDHEWDFFVGGYLTATYIDATTTAGTPAGDQVLDIDASFSDLLDNLDYGASGIFIASYDKLSINVDLLAIGLDIDESTPIPPPIGPAEVNIQVDIREYELYLGYQAFAEYPALEVITGLRYIDQEITVDLTTAGPMTPAPLVAGDDWVDPFIGFRYLGPINNKWSWLLRGDIGGFGVGSDFAWRVDVGARYHITKQWEAAVGYKILDIDYETGTSGSLSRYAWDGSEAGITLGVGYHF